MAKFVNQIFVLLLVGGLARMFMQSQSHTRLENEHRRLAVMHGELDIKDSNKYLVTRVDTGDPMQFLSNLVRLLARLFDLSLRFLQCC